MDAYILNDVRIKQLFFENADEAVCLADSTKFFKSGTMNWLGFDRLKAIITDPSINPEVLQLLQEKGVRLLR